jgi:Zn-dependent protease
VTQMGNWFHWPPSWTSLLLLPALVVGFTVHEFAHAVVALLLGDTSQIEQKRLSLNPIRHISWVGMAAFMLFGFGWAKPVRMDTTRFRMRNRALGVFLVSIAGASANLIAAVLVLAGMTVTVSAVWTFTGASPMAIMEFLLPAQVSADAQGLAVALSYYMMMVNLVLAFFNLIPIPPLDGFQAAYSLIVAIRMGLRRGAADEPTIQPAAAPSAPAPADAARSPAQIHFDIGLEYQRAGQLDEAIARYRQATAHDERFGLAYYNLGVAYWAKERIPLAVSAFKAAADSVDDLEVRVEAQRRLRELSQAEHEPGAMLGPAPMPLEARKATGAAVSAPAPLDPAVMRRAWVSLVAAGAELLLLAGACWFYVTMVALVSVQ